MFIGVQFDEEEGANVAVVHKNWLSPRKSDCWWPPYKKQNQFTDSLKKGESPNEEKWKLYKISRKFFFEEDYHKSQTKIKKLEITSDLNSTDNEDEGPPLKRRVLKPSRFVESSEEEDSSQNCLPPKVKGIHELLNRSVCNEGTDASIASSSYINLPVTTSTPKASQVDGTVTNTDTTIQPIDGSTTEYKKILQQLVLIKNQNSEILHILKSNRTINATVVDLPADIPVGLPVQNLKDLQELENYLNEADNFNLVLTYLSTLGGHDIVSKTNSILKKVLSNIVASQFSFLGTRNGKKNFQNLNLRKLIVGAVLTKCSSSTEADVDNAIKVWLKHAPKRLASLQKRNEAI